MPHPIMRSAGLLGLAQIGKNGVVGPEPGNCILVGNSGGDDDILTLFPVRWRRHLVFGRQLDGIDRAKNFLEVPPCGHWVGEDQLDLLVGTHDEDGAHGGVIRRRSAFGTVASARRQHIIELCDLQILVADQRIVDIEACCRADIVFPFLMALDRINRDANDLDATLLKFRLQSAHRAKFRRANRREILRMRKQHRPAVTDPVVKAHRTMCGLGREVGCYIVDTQAHLMLSP
ncbi:hypothetical protein AT6N2_C0807 [Agrobacterium tumefaciens]|nr:hypothetical protein AT6N2_C0807 [Agrobacterium tumefaciens]